VNGADVWAWARAKVAGKRARGRWGRGRARARVHERARLWMNCGTGRRRGEEGNDRRACLVRRGRTRLSVLPERAVTGRAGDGERGDARLRVGGVRRQVGPDCSGSRGTRGVGRRARVEREERRV